jgi:hypothetical protein
MLFEFQTGSRDCFPTCFRNALRFLGVSLTPEITRRLSQFEKGTESCRISDAEERLELYGRSIHKFLSEWRWAVRHSNDTEWPCILPEPWTLELAAAGIGLELRNGPNEQKNLFLSSLLKGYVIICDIQPFSTGISGYAGRHAVLLIGSRNGRLLVHDPMLYPSSPRGVHTSFRNISHQSGANLEIECTYFFSNDPGPFKPEPNPSQSDYGYRFLIISRN